MNGSNSGLGNNAPGTQLSFEQNEVTEIAKGNEELLNSSMPNFSEAETPKEKFINYSLDYDNPNAKGKAEAYQKGLGYTKNNASGLISQVHNAVTSGLNPYEVSQSNFGTKYKYRIPVTGPNGKTKNVIAVYQIDKGTTKPRMITNYLEKGRKK